MRNLAFVAGLTVLLLGSAALADTIDVHMKNKSAEGMMVFEPGFVRAQPGDTINFISVDKGHNVETIVGMLPDGAEPMKSKLSENFSVVLTVEGLYGIKCTPHYGMGMVALIEVGSAGNYDAAAAVTQKGKAKARLETYFAMVVR